MSKKTETSQSLDYSNNSDNIDMNANPNQQANHNLDELLKNILTPIHAVTDDFCCGLVAIVGRPNVGKSSLMNLLIGEKISITSHKAQTTRHHIMGILSRDDMQMVFVDTPGFQTKYNQALNKNLNKTMTSTLTGVDLVVFVIEAKGFKAEDQKVLDILPKDLPIILLINKIDLISQLDLLALLNQVKEFPFVEFIPFSVDKNEKAKERFSKQVLIDATHAEHIHETDSALETQSQITKTPQASKPPAPKIHRDLENLLSTLKKYLPTQPPIYSQEQITTQSTQFLITELIREKVFRLTGDELPYQTTVVIDQFEKNRKLTRVFATILVEKPAHKAMIIGENGQKIKKISQLARLDMEKTFSTKVYLELWVKVKSGWADTEANLRAYGYN